MRVFACCINGQKCMYLYICSYVRICMYGYEPVCMFVCTHMQVRLWTCLYTWKHTIENACAKAVLRLYTHIYMHTCNIETKRKSLWHTHTNTHIHTYTGGASKARHDLVRSSHAYTYTHTYQHAYTYLYRRCFQSSAWPHSQQSCNTGDQKTSHSQGKWLLQTLWALPETKMRRSGAWVSVHIYVCVFI